MRAADFHKIFAQWTGATVGEIDQRTRWMHRLGMIRGRGRHAPHLSVMSPEISLMLLSLAARRAVDAEKVAQRLSMLSPVPRSGVPSTLAMRPERTVVAALAIFVMSEAGYLAETDGERLDIQSIEISETGDFAWIVFNSGMRLLYTDDEAVWQTATQKPELYEKQFTARIDRRLYIGASILSMIAARAASEQNGARLAVDHPPASHDSGSEGN